jgi:hypothetical protein
MAIQYKFVELSIVTDETIEECVNEWVGKSWQLEGIRFAMAEHSKRPAMAFVSFTRETAATVADTAAPRRPPPLLRPVPDESDGPRVISAGHDDVE